MESRKERRGEQIFFLSPYQLKQNRPVINPNRPEPSGVVSCGKQEGVCLLVRFVRVW